MNWENFRQRDGSIDLISAFNSENRSLNISGIKAARDFLLSVMDLRPITSRQAAAVAVAHARALVATRVAGQGK